MTNKEKLQEIFPNMIFTGTVMMYKPTEQVLASRINYSWLNAEYEEPTTKNNLGVREFEEIEVTYPPEEVCIYPEYKGKPYFGIKYKENGKEIVGYGTYNPEVLSQYLRDYFISTTKNDLGVDCISREQAIQTIQRYGVGCFDADEFSPEECERFVIGKLNKLPSVTPQEPRWISVSERLPEEYGEYLITWTTSSSKKPFIAICECENTTVYDHEHNRFKVEWLFDDYIKAYPDVEVRAWIPLPKPYKAESEDI